MSSSSSESYSGERWSIAPAQKVRPITEPRWSRIFAPAGSRSMRAPIIAWSVSGIRSPPSAPSSSEHAHRLLDEERIALGLVEQARTHLPGHLVFLEQRVGERLALLARERLELDRGRADAPASPARPDVEQLGPREADDQQRALAHPLREMVDQLEQRLLGPVDVLEDHDQRLDVGQLVGELACRPRDLRLRRARPRPPPSRRRRARAARRSPRRRSTRSASRLRRLHRIVVRDPGGRLDHLGQRPVRDALAVRQRAAGEDRRALDAGEELADQAALADARLAVDREDVRPAVADRALERVLEQLELGVAADERRGDLRVRADRRARAMAGTRRSDCGTRAARAARRTRPRCGPTVRRCAASPMRISPGAAACWRRAATFTASPVANVESVSSTTTSPASIPIRASRPSSRTCSRIPSAGADGAVGVVLVRVRDPEGGHDGVAGELLDRAAVRLDAARDAVEEGRHAAPRDLRILAGDELGRRDQVGEQDRRQLPFHSRILGTARVPM